MKIFLIEDDKSLVKMIESQLSRYAFETFIPQDFEKILEEFHRIEPDLVLLDVNLPFLMVFIGVKKSASNPWYPFCLFRLVTVIWIK
ncbi:hypothetical protein OM428_17630 [Enterococcus gallinarum]|nr:hypothetical protein [Enterococcus gallinarum]MCW3745992.1 hypothetical protein [Enterococcus gallinarum]